MSRSRQKLPVQARSRASTKTRVRLGRTHATPNGMHAVRYAAPSRRPRIVAFFVLCGTAGLFALAARIEPSPAGFGSHALLGLPSCSLPARTGYPCPTCGMTTAFAYFARGRLLASFHTQPAGFAFAVMLAGVVFAGCWTLVTGRVVVPRGDWFSPVRVTAILIGVMVFGWLYKVTTGLVSGALPMRV